LAVRPRQIAPVALFLALTVAGFIIARVLAERNVRDDSEHRAEVAAAQIRSRVAQAASLTESLRRFMLDASGTGVTSDEFARNALRWLSPARFPAAAWVEQVPASRRAAYERRSGQPIVTPDERHKAVPLGSRSSSLPATLVSGFPPMAVPGIDLSGAPGMARVLTRATRLDRVAATPIAPPSTGTSGLFLVAPAPNLIGEVLHPGYVVVFASAPRLRAAATDAPTVQIRTSGTSTERAETASETFTAAGQRFDVVVPRGSVQGAAAVLPWIILAGGLVVAALGGALGLNAARRARAQDELDRVFTLSSDLIAVANFDGYFTRVNPAAERVLGYTEKELLARPYLDFVHPDDRETTAAEAAAIGQGKATLSFQNRFLHKDGSYRVLEWTATPVVEEGVMYGVARDVSERRQAEAEVERLAEEQAALHRVATLVAQGVQPGEIFSAVTQEVARVFSEVEPSLVPSIIRFDPGPEFVLVGAAKPMLGLPVGSRWGLKDLYVSTRVLRTGRSARVDEMDLGSLGGPDAELLRRQGFLYQVGSPIIVQGRLWGAMTMNSKEALPPDTDERLESFTELVATAIANAEATEALARLANEQAALRRVATLVAREAPQAEVFTAIAKEIGQLLGTEEIRMVRYEDDRTGVVVASAGRAEDLFPIGSRVSLGSDTAASRVFRTGAPVRIDDYTEATGPIAQQVRSTGVRGVVAAPVSVEGRLWGAMTAGTTQDEPLPPGTESHLGQFTDLMATAIANTESHARADRLGEEQAALRRVATLVAKESPPAEVFAKVAEELANVLGDVECSLFRDEGDGTASVVALWGEGVAAGAQVGTRLPLDGDGVIACVLRERRPCRIGDYSAVGGAIAERGREAGIRSAVGCPVVVRGRIWGAMAAARYEAEAFPAEAETRVAQFAELVATAIANADARAEVERLAEEQAALRRVATLVAERASPAAVLDAVAGEMEALLDADQVALNRFEPGDEILVLAHRGLDVARTPVGSRVSIEGESATAAVRRTGRPARVENYEGARGALAELARETGLRSSVAAPIVVEGRLWGLITASWKGEQSPPAGTEERMSRFAQLLDTAIANAEARAELMASRARLVAASDEARRRFERDLHDGVQQRLVLLSLEVRSAEAMGPPDNEELAEQLAHVRKGLAEALDDLRELSRGIHPAILSEGGLVPALKALARRSAVPVQLDLAIAERLAEHVEIGAYYVVSEALTNAVKHARASKVDVHARSLDGVLELKIDDDGIGGADPSRGSGLTGLADRVEALGGTIWITSPPGEGTSLRVELSLDGQ
jgi:PAS domain S-box-containing protein